MTEKHRDELCLRAESLGVTLSAPFGDQVVKLRYCEKLRNNLTKRTRNVYHVVCPLADLRFCYGRQTNDISKTAGLFNVPKNLFWTRVICYNKSTFM